MSTRDLHSHVAVAALLAAQALTASTNSSGADTLGFESVELVIHVGTVTNIANSPQPSWTFHLEESDDNSVWTDVTDSNLVLIGSALSPVAAPDSSTGVFLTIDAAAEDAKTYRVGYVGTKRYVRVVATAANTPGSTPMYILAILGNPSIRPTQDV